MRTPAPQHIQDAIVALEKYFESDLGTQITMHDGIVTVVSRHFYGDCENQWMETRRNFEASWNDEDVRVVEEVI